MKRKNKLRNIGIIAHVDAGKTTVSERILYVTGNLHRAGDVHTGNTALDYKPWERSHGITVSSAATSVEWKGHVISMIDTPGHIDFNIEVKRALRVLDGAIVVFDAVSGVEPQTETNWRLADQFEVPRIAFVNKMDRNGANFAQVCSMMQESFDTVALPIHVPVRDDDGDFVGLIDLVTMRKHTWIDEVYEVEVVDNDVTSIELRGHMLENLALMDEEFMSIWEANIDIDLVDIQASIKRATIAGEAVPVLCGTALKHMGVNLVLDAVVDYLPEPKGLVDGYDHDELVAYAFKAEATKHRTFTFCRIYQGKMSEGDVVYNSNTEKQERIGRIYRIFADNHVEISTAEAGEIVALAGLKHTHMGHTLSSVIKGHLLEEVIVPEPVTAMSIEAKDSNQRQKIAEGLQILLREDPSLRVATNKETGQLILSGMGELHLQIACERLNATTGCEMLLGKPQVAYRETVTESAMIEHLLKKQGGGPGMYAGVTLSITPLDRGAGFKFESCISNGVIANEFIPSVEKGIRQHLTNGIVDGQPVVDVKVNLLDGKMHSNDSSGKAFENVGYEAMGMLLRMSNSVLLEPVMSTSIECPAENIGAVIGDVNRRRGLVKQQLQVASGRIVLDAEIPLERLLGVVDDLRSLTSGRSSFSMEFDHYAEVN